MSQAQPQSAHRVGGSAVKRYSPTRRSPARGPDFAFCHNTLWPISQQRSPGKQQGQSPQGYGRVQFQQGLRDDPYDDQRARKPTRSSEWEPPRRGDDPCHECEKQLAELRGLCDGRHQGLQEAIAGIRALVEGLRQNGPGVDPQLEALAKGALDLQRDIGELRDELRKGSGADSVSQQKDIKEQMRQLQDELRELRSNSERMERELDNLRREQQKPNELASVVQDLQQRLAAVESAQKQSDDTASVKSAGSAAVLAALSQRIEATDSRMSDLEKRVGERLSDLSRKLGERISIDADLAAVENKVGQIAEDIEGLRRQPATSSSSVSDDKFQSLVRRIEALEEMQRSLAQITDEIEDIKATQNDLPETMGLQDLRKRAEETDSRIGELSGFADSLQKTLDDRIHQLQEKNLELETQIQAELGKMRRALEVQNVAGDVSGMTSVKKDGSTLSQLT